MKGRKKMTVCLMAVSVFLILFSGMKTTASDRSIPICHHHGGSAEQGGGCYTKQVYHIHTDACLINEFCPGKVTRKEIDTDRLGGYYGWWRHDFDESLGCEQCNLMKEDHPDGIHPWYYKKTVYTCDKCGKAYGAEGNCKSVVGQHYGCSKEEEITGYELGCGLLENDVLGSFQVIADATDMTAGTKRLHAVIVNGGRLKDLRLVWNTGNKNDTMIAKKNEKYTCTLFYKDSGMEYSVADAFTVTDIDIKPPVISNFGGNLTYTRDDVILTVTATDRESGLAEEPYSFDREHYGKSATLTVSQNGVYRVYVRDKRGNTSWAQCVVRCIDKEAPVISAVSVINPEMTAGNVTLKVTAEDELSGLNEQAYSMDGTHYQRSPLFTIQMNGTYQVWVRDAVGNKAYSICTVTNIDKEAPGIRSFAPISQDYTRDSVTLHAEAVDHGSGLAEKAYSFQGGAYADKSDFSVSENGKYTICVRDAVGNVSSAVYILDLIDRTPPKKPVLVLEPKEWYEGDAMIRVVTDPSEPFPNQYISYDDGKTWSSNPKLVIHDGGMYSVVIRDAAGNQSSDIIITKRLAKKDEKPNLEQNAGSEKPGNGTGTDTAGSDKSADGAVKPESGTGTDTAGSDKSADGAVKPGSGTGTDTAGSDKSADGAVKPGSGTGTDTAGSDKSADGAVKPGSGTGTDTAGSDKSADGAVKPGSGTGTDTAGSDKSADGAVKPGSGTGIDTAGSDKSADRAVKPGSGTGTDTAGSDKSADKEVKPGSGTGTDTAGSDKSADKEVKPGNGTGTDTAGSDKSGGGTVEPGSEIGTDTAGSDKSGGGAVKPGSGTGTDTAGSDKSADGTDTPGTKKGTAKSGKIPLPGTRRQDDYKELDSDEAERDSLENADLQSEDDKHSDSQNLHLPEKSENVTTVSVDSEFIASENSEPVSVKEKYAKTKKRMAMEQKAKEIVKVTAITAATSVGIVCVLYGCFLWLFSATVCYRTPDGTYKKIGRVLIHRKGSRYLVKIESSIFSLAGSRYLVLKIPYWFAFTHRYKEIEIQYNDKYVTEYILSEIMLEAK